MLFFAGPAACQPSAAEPASEIRDTRPVPRLISIEQFLAGAAGWGEETQVRVRGTVTHSLSDRTFFIQEGDAGVYVFHKPPSPYLVGELVEVSGYPSLGGTRPSLQRCESLSLGTRPLPPPVAITAAKAREGAYDMRLVQVRGRLAPERLRGGHTLVLKSEEDQQVFTADLELFADLSPFDALRPGSLVEVTGVCSARRDPLKRPASFNLFVRTPEDIRTVRGPSWWTPERMWRGLGLAALGCLLAMAWVVTLRNQVRRQTADIRLLNEELEQRVRRRTTELTEANKELELFTYSVSHDLRAPLRHISGFAGMLASSSLVADRADTRRQLEIIVTAANRMGQLIDELLAFSRIGRQPLSFGEVPLNPLVADVLRELQTDTAGRAIEWKIAALPTVHGDLISLRLIWQNLLSNAIKYTRHRNPAVIEIGFEERPDERIFFVRDNGAGFDMQYAGRLFGMFQRLHRDDEFEGSGIGLANVRRMVNRYGGRAWAEAEPDRGATFYFSLPRHSQVRSVASSVNTAETAERRP